MKSLCAKFRHAVKLHTLDDLLNALCGHVHICGMHI